MKSQMKNIAKIVVAVMATNSVVMTYPTVQNAQAAIVSAASKSLTIARAASAYEKATTVDNLPVEIAAGNLMSAMVEAGVTKDDLLAYAAQYASSPAEAKRAAQNIEFALKGVSPEALADMTDAEQAAVMGEALKVANAQGVAWSGCAGKRTGIVLLVVAVGAAIFGLIKMPGEKRIHSKFDKKRANEKASYEANVQHIENRPNEIQTQISNATTNINNTNVQIAYWQGQLSAALANNNLSAAQTANANIQSYQADLQSYNNQIASLNNELSLYNDPNYAANQIASLTVQYNSAVASLNSTEANQIALVPENQRLGKGFLIGAGVSAAIGTYLTIDGVHDCDK